MAREFDICLYGATGFTGKLVAEYFATKPDLKWAIAGRNVDKLNEVKQSLGESVAVEVIVADSADEDSIRSMASRSKVICTTVGPYLKYGKLVVKACVEEKTHYCDLTGEFPFIYEMINKYHDECVENKIKIVHSCGYDCVPVDLGTMLVTKELPTVTKLRTLCTRANGLPSGGTLASGRGASEWAKQPENQTAAKDPYVLVPGIEDDNRKDEKWTKKSSVGYDSYFGTISGPYFMAPIDNRLVRRSLALRKIFCSYDEALSIGAAGKVAAFALKHLPSVVNGLSPKPGDGPSKSVRNDGGFSFSIKGNDDEGNKASLTVHGKGDPGYEATSILMGECALCLAFDEAEDRYGVITPSVAMGETLVERLRQTGRFQFISE